MRRSKVPRWQLERRVEDELSDLSGISFEEAQKFLEPTYCEGLIGDAPIRIKTYAFYEDDKYPDRLMVWVNVDAGGLGWFRPASGFIYVDRSGSSPAA